jgi:hypothetical protein
LIFLATGRRESNGNPLVFQIHSVSPLIDEGNGLGRLSSIQKELLLKMLANDQPDKNSESTQSVEIKLKHISLILFFKKQNANKMIHSPGPNKHKNTFCWINSQLDLFDQSGGGGGRFE